jgi:hypothetical protein
MMQSANFNGELAPLMEQFFDFDQFDTMGGTRVLKSVTLEIDATIGADVTAENNNLQAAPEFGISLTGFAEVALLGLEATANINTVQASGGVGGSDNAGVPDGMGPDFFDFGTVSGMDSDDDTVGMMLAAFIGNGMITASVTGNGGFAVTGASNSTLDVDNFGASGTIRLIYEFNVIPTPGAAGLLGLAGIAAVRRRR